MPTCYRPLVFAGVAVEGTHTVAAPVLWDWRSQLPGWLLSSSTWKKHALKSFQTGQPPPLFLWESFTISRDLFHAWWTRVPCVLASAWMSDHCWGTVHAEHLLLFS